MKTINRFVPIMLGHILFPNVKGQGMIHGYCSHCSINSYPITFHYASTQTILNTYISHKPQFLFLDEQIGNFCIFKNDFLGFKNYFIVVHADFSWNTGVSNLEDLVYLIYRIYFM